MDDDQDDGLAEVDAWPKFVQVGEFMVNLSHVLAVERVEREADLPGTVVYLHLRRGIRGLRDGGDRIKVEGQMARQLWEQLGGGSPDEP